VQVAGRVARRWADQPAVWIGGAAVAALVLWLLLR
jgi:hypothetical protein